MNPVYDLEETLASGLRYTEETQRTERSLPIRDCSLWQTGVTEPISGLNVASFRQRFGAVTIPAEGIGGVETLPAFRRQGHIGTLLNRAVESMSKRVAVAFVSDGIEEMYEKFGFVNCLAESYLSLRVRHIERVSSRAPAPAAQRVRGFSPDDLPAMVELYNQAHRYRPWTHERPTTWNRLHETQTWQPGSTAIILERADRIAGYAIFREPRFGHPSDSFIIDELTAADSAAAQALLIDLAARCWAMRLSEFWVREPLDSAVGRAAQQFGCTHHLTYPPSGGMMGAILNRQQLLPLLEPELQRRLTCTELRDAHPAAFEALCRSNIIADNGLLLRLLIGHWSAAQARAVGALGPEAYEQVIDAWFPGGGTATLPQPYAHSLDRY